MNIDILFKRSKINWEFIYNKISPKCKKITEGYNEYCSSDRSVRQWK